MRLLFVLLLATGCGEAPEPSASPAPLNAQQPESELETASETEIESESESETEPTLEAPPELAPVPGEAPAPERTSVAVIPGKVRLIIVPGHVGGEILPSEERVIAGAERALARHHQVTRAPVSAEEHQHAIEFLANPERSPWPEVWDSFETVLIVQLAEPEERRSKGVVSVAVLSAGAAPLYVAHTLNARQALFGEEGWADIVELMEMETSP